MIFFMNFNAMHWEEKNSCIEDHFLEEQLRDAIVTGSL